VARSRAIVDANLPLLDEFFARWEGVFDGCARGATASASRGSAAWRSTTSRASCVCEEGVLLLRGLGLRAPGNHFPRVGFGRRNLPEALAAWSAFAARRL
jgi:hypothetical protein